LLRCNLLSGAGEEGVGEVLGGSWWLWEWHGRGRAETIGKEREYAGVA